MGLVEGVEAASFVASGAALAFVSARFAARSRGPERLATGLIFAAALAALLWMTPMLLGFDEDEVPWVELSEAAFFFLVAAGVFTWSASLLSRHALRIEAAYGSLERAAREKQMFLDILGHDVRNPLSAAMLRADVLKAKHPATAPEVAAIAGSLQKANAIIEQSLLLSRLDEGAPLALAPQEVVPLVEHAVDGLRPLAAQKGVVVSVAGHAGLVEAHALLANAVENIVSNAVKWSPKDAPVEVRLAEEDHRLRIAIVDHGPGVPPEKRAQLFQRFERLGRTDEKGVGLGLAIAARLVERHHGRILVEETPGGGATFVIELPAAPRAAPGHADASAHASPA